MALWEYVVEYPDGRRETRVIAAGNAEAASKRANRHAEGLGGEVVEGPRVRDAHRGSL